MKHLKYFEHLNQNEPQDGDYIITNVKFLYQDITDYLQTHIGKILTTNGEDDEFPYYIEYDKPDFDLSELKSKPGIILRFTEKHIVITIEREEIEYWSDNKEELEEILTNKKYNL